MGFQAKQMKVVPSASGSRPGTAIVSCNIFIEGVFKIVSVACLLLGVSLGSRPAAASVKMKKVSDFFLPILSCLILSCLLPGKFHFSMLASRP